MRRISQAARQELTGRLLPFWKALRDEEIGGYYGYMDFDLNRNKKAEKGCILNSRILWFFSEAAIVLQDDSLIPYARHAYAFLTEKCLDRELFRLIEENCTDEGGYLEAFSRDFQPVSNEKLSENGVMAQRTMNTLLHVFEGYAGLYQAAHDPDVADAMGRILDIYAAKVYNPKLHRQEVFFDKDYRSLIDLTSYGHDIESSWLMDWGTALLEDKTAQHAVFAIDSDLAENILRTALQPEGCVVNECERGKVDAHRIWWVQAEAVLGFVNAWEKHLERIEYRDAAVQVWRYIQEHLVDRRPGGEWFWRLDENNRPDREKPIVEPWKCPYHNGRMCLELIRRDPDVYV